MGQRESEITFMSVCDTTMAGGVIDKLAQVCFQFLIAGLGCFVLQLLVNEAFFNLVSRAMHSPTSFGIIMQSVLPLAQFPLAKSSLRGAPDHSVCVSPVQQER